VTAPEPSRSAPAGRRLTRSGRLVPADLDAERIGLVVRDFYGTARLDPLLGPIFDGAIPAEDWPRHLATIEAFWSALLLGTTGYDGRPMPKHLALPGLEDRHFARWLELFAAASARHCSPEAAALFVDRAERIAQSFRLGLAFHRGQDTASLAPLAWRPGV